MFKIFLFVIKRVQKQQLHYIISNQHFWKILDAGFFDGNRKASMWSCVLRMKLRLDLRVKNQALLVPSQTNINLNGNWSFYSCKQWLYFPWIQFAYPQEPMICQFWGIIFYICVGGVFPDMLNLASLSNELILLQNRETELPWEQFIVSNDKITITVFHMDLLHL